MDAYQIGKPHLKRFTIILMWFCVVQPALSSETSNIINGDQCKKSREAARDTVIRPLVEIATHGDLSDLVFIDRRFDGKLHLSDALSQRGFVATEDTGNPYIEDLYYNRNEDARLHRAHVRLAIRPQNGPVWGALNYCPALTMDEIMEEIPHPELLGKSMEEIATPDHINTQEDYFLDFIPKVKSHESLLRLTISPQQVTESASIITFITLSQDVYENDVQ